MAPTQYTAEREQLIVTTYGELTEGLRALGPLPAQELQSLQRRFQARRHLAFYALYPEGYVFSHELTDGENIQDDDRYAVVLLTPPDLVAVRATDGTWERRVRTEDDGPAPYTHEWYYQYLVANHLPRWFMRPEHTSLLSQNIEAASLDLDDDSATRNAAHRVPANYLFARYPVEPQYPTPDTQEYQVHLRSNEIARLARRFPAVLESRRRKDYRIYVTPRGYVIIRHRDQDDPHNQELRMDRVQWTNENSENRQLASYVVEEGTSVTENTPRTINFTMPLRDRSAEVNAVPEGSYVDLDQLAWGPGQYRWLNPAVDGLLAAAINLTTPAQAVEAIQNGVITGSLPTWMRPRTVYTPDPANFNPRRQTTRYGRWEYFTTLGDGSSRELARVNLGGQEPWFVDTAMPSAAQVAYLRSMYHRGFLKEDCTAGIDIVWIPSDTPMRGNDWNWSDDDLDSNDGGDNDSSDGDDPDHPDDMDADQDQDQQNIDPDSGLTHSPSNDGGQHDQTAARGAGQHYQTRMINGRKFTLDRAPAHQNVIESHKTWAVDNQGRWRQYKNHATLDWTKDADVQRLNKWRDQQCDRHGWPKKRKDIRPDYTGEQKKWVFDRVAADGGEKKPAMRMDDLAAEFNRRFSTERNVPGITALFSRMAKKYKASGGVWSEGPRRGSRKKEGAERRRRSNRDGSDEEREDQNPDDNNPDDEE